MVDSRKNKLTTIIKKLFNEDITPALEMHKGGCQLISVSELDNDLYIIIKYDGTCFDCSSSKDQTLTYIKNYLLETLKELNLIKGELYVEAITANKLNKYSFLD